MKKIKIYIIDDNEFICDALNFFLDSFSALEVIIFHNPMLFLNELNPNLDGCLIVDLFLPSMNGFELIKKIRQQNTNLKIILTSGYGATHVEKTALEAGANDFILKPFNIDALLRKIQTLLKLENYYFNIPA